MTSAACSAAASTSLGSTTPGTTRAMFRSRGGPAWRGWTSSSARNVDRYSCAMARPDPMPERLVPMLARLSTLPPDDEHWAYEIKWDGVRAVAYVEKDGTTHLESRNLND